MPKLTFLPMGAAIDAAPGEPLADAARRAGVAIDAECGGKGTCRACMAMVTEGRVEGDSASFLPREAVEEGFVLLCRSRAGGHGAPDTVITTSGRAPQGAGQFEHRDDAPAARAGGADQKAGRVCRVFEPLAFRVALDVPQPRPLDGLSDADRLARALREAVCCAAVDIPLPVLRTLAGALRRDQGRVTALCRMDGPRLALLGLAPGAVSGLLAGAAIDLGTTTVAVQLVDLETGTPLARATDYNDQTARGLDVISRINYAGRPGGLDELRGLGLRSVNRVLDRAARDAGLAPDAVAAVSIAGNTVMTHLLLGMDPEHIRLDPYTPTVFAPGTLAAGEVGIAAHPLAPTLFAPAVGSYVGGDITSGAVTTDLAGDSEAVRLFIDIGTNGEVVVGSASFCLACACSAGPAFEGGGLTCGMRASVGAIEKVAIDPATGAPAITVIGNVPPQGVCGSGIIEILAGLFRSGWLDAAGRLATDRACGHIIPHGKRRAYVLAAGADTASGQPILITETDIDNVLRAKAAIHSGCAHLLEQVGLDFGDLEEIVIAGGFGRFLDIESAIGIGLLPDAPRHLFRYVGNASLAGAARALVSAKWRAARAALAGRMTYVDLSTDAGWMDQYTAALFLPHTDASRFPSVKPAKV
ncbi:MAG: ASKHA domain-containing protein [Desulfovibrionaceae bacterium]